MDNENVSNIKTKRYGFVLISTLVILIIFLKTLTAPPESSPASYQLSIESGQTLFSISNELHKDNVIKSKRLFEIFMITFGSEKRISEGEYYFAHPMSALGIAWRISTKDFGIEKVKVTFPEGFTNKEMAERLAQVIPSIKVTDFVSLTKGKEGYLFPDTYSFFPNVSEEKVIQTLEDNFDKKLSPLYRKIASSGYSKKDLITMASIIEREAKGEDDRSLISGILWRRLSLGMPLQVDAPFFYILDRTKLKTSDFAIKSPYNTYINTGLPPTPIGNPGLEAIRAAIDPENSDYLYYLHDKDQNIHYAKTYTEHQANIRKYLK